MIIDDKDGIIHNAFAAASEKAKRRLQKDLAENKKVICQCDKCGTDIHIADEHYGDDDGNYCAACKPKGAKKMIPIPAFTLAEALKGGDHLTRKAAAQNKKGGRSE